MDTLWHGQCLQMFGIASNAQDFINKSMKSQKLDWNAS